LVRNPIDAISSFYRYAKMPCQFDEWMEREMTNWEEFHQYWIQQDNVLWIHYNEIEKRFAEILEFMEIPVDEEAIKRAFTLYPRR